MPADDRGRRGRRSRGTASSYVLRRAAAFDAGSLRNCLPAEAGVTRMKRAKPWEIAADLETAALAIRAAVKAIDAVHHTASDEINAIRGPEMVDRDMADAFQALSDKYQAIEDAEPDDREIGRSHVWTPVT